MIAIPKTRYTPPELAALLGVSPDKILGWIRSGELRAVNVAARLGGKPRWTVSTDDLRAFETRRSNEARTLDTTERRRRLTGVIEYF
jgi:excisionase family DNA binding protein